MNDAIFSAICLICITKYLLCDGMSVKLKGRQNLESDAFDAQFLLNQARAWFLIIASVHEFMYVCVCVFMCVCVRPRGY